MNRTLTTDDLLRLADLSARAHTAADIYAAVDALVHDVIGHKLFTVMRVHEDTAEVERTYSSNTTAYPVGGRKGKRGTPWSRVVLDRGEVFIARDRDEVREAFSDHELIESLGIGSIMNVPLSYRGRQLGTMNVSHVAGWFKESDVAAGRLIAPFVVPLLLTE
ncbi:MAG TPA: GAF domain-containing protein [Casimicrobiaceae bacterium]|nr:GAF domain-containing protein [Casimicrobiaceae bacterium]